MRIGIDISQLAYQNTGVANYLANLVENLIRFDKKNEYILFFSSLRGELPTFEFLDTLTYSNVRVKIFKFPPLVLDLMWNKLHVFPIEHFIGPVDIFISSDWTQPPTRRAKKVTILYDLIVYKSPEETAKKIIATQKRKLFWTKKECDAILCISQSTKKDAMELLKIPEEKLKVVYPGFNNVISEMTGANI